MAKSQRDDDLESRLERDAEREPYRRPRTESIHESIHERRERWFLNVGRAFTTARGDQ